MSPDKNKTRVLICGILPPPYFGHSMIYKILIDSQFVDTYDVIFFNMKFWSYGKHKKVTILKLLQFVRYFFQYIFLILTRRPHYVLYGISFDKIPFLKDFLFCMTGRLLGCRVVLHDMGQYLRELYEAGGGVHKKLVRLFLKNTTASIVLGEKARYVYDGFLDLNRVIAVPGAVEDTINITTQQNEDNRKDNTSSVKVLYFSFLSVSKGFLTALYCIPEVVKRNPKVHFTFAGPIESENLRQMMIQFAEEHHLNSNVQYIGYVGDEVLRTQCFRATDIFIFPTQRDVFGLVLLHAMAESAPIIASYEGCIPEIIEDGKNGFLFPKGDHRQLVEKIIMLADNPQLRQRIGEENRRKYLNFYTPEKYGERMMGAFNKIEQMSSKNRNCS